MSSFQEQYGHYLARVESQLRQALPDDAQSPLTAAMRYSALGGGKRLRPLLVYLSGEAVGASLEQLDNAAVAVELIHCYSLVHDDLPAMDDDVLRRGQPTCHVAYNEATAILAGDALQALAFERLCKPSTYLSPKQQLAQMHCLTTASGYAGMVGGQQLDIMLTDNAATVEQLKQCHSMKTGALLQAAVVLGALASPDLADEKYQALDDFGALLGLAFQVQDDVLDCLGDKEALGKTPNKDVTQNKSTYVKLLGLSGAQQFATELLDRATARLDVLGAAAEQLIRLAQLLSNRES